MDASPVGIRFEPNPPIQKAYLSSSVIFLTYSIT